MNTIKTIKIPSAMRVSGSVQRRNLQNFEAEFDSIGHVVAVAGLSRQANGGRMSAERVDDTVEHNEKPNNAWTNGASLSKIAGWLRDSRPNLVERVNSMKNRLEELVQSPTRERRRLRRNQEDGDEIDPQAVLERRIDGWTRIDHVTTPKHVVSIGVNLTVHCRRQPEDLLYRGAAAAALADLLTQAGHSVEVIGFVTTEHTSDSANELMMRVPLKLASAPLDLSSLSVAAAEIGFFRTVMIPCIGRVTPGTVSFGFGSVRGLNTSERAGMDAVLDSNVLNEESAVRAVINAMAAITKAKTDNH